MTPLVDGTPGLARVERDRVAEGPGERLELRLDEVVRVAAGEHPDVQRDLGVEGDRLEDVPGQRAEVAVVADLHVDWPSGSPVCTQ
jgi:hypothetical protein